MSRTYPESPFTFSPFSTKLTGLDLSGSFHTEIHLSFYGNFG